MKCCTLMCHPLYFLNMKSNMFFRNLVLEASLVSLQRQNAKLFWSKMANSRKSGKKSRSSLMQKMFLQLSKHLSLWPILCMQSKRVATVQFTKYELKSSFSMLVPFIFFSFGLIRTIFVPQVPFSRWKSVFLFVAVFLFEFTRPKTRWSNPKTDSHLEKAFFLSRSPVFYFFPTANLPAPIHSAFSHCDHFWAE